MKLHSPIRALALCIGILSGLSAVDAQEVQPQSPATTTGNSGESAPAAAAPAAPAPVQNGGPDAAPSASEPALPLATQPAPAAPAASDPAMVPAAGAMPVEDAAAPNPALPHDLSPWGMFIAADWVVKGVMIGLAFASLVTWTIWLAKALELMAARSRARRAVSLIEEASSLDGAAAGASRALKRGPVAAILHAALEEKARSGELSADGVKERVAIAVSRIEARAGRNMTRGTGVLATIGSTAPFVGLFGTVWGIMNSFIGISQANTTNLAVVAPGIAEALLATAIGLVAAIPAVIIYNSFARSTAGYRAVLADGAAAVMQHLSRALDQRDAGSQYRLHAAAE